MLIAADNLSAARPSVRKALESRDAEAVSRLCRRAQDAGAHWLDVNPGYAPSARRKELWRFAVTTAERACGLTLMLDAPDAATLAMGVELCSRPPVLNMATAQPERLGPVLDIAQANGLAVVAAAMTDRAPLSSEERLSLAALIVQEAEKRGVTGERLILDPMVMPLALPGGEVHARSVIEAIRAVPFLFDPAPLTMIAVSNLATHTAGARAGFAAPAFLAAAWGAGLGAVMCDVFDNDLARTIKLCRVFQGQRVFAPAEF